MKQIPEILAAEYQEDKKRIEVASASVRQSEARLRARQAEGTLQLEADLARREKYLATRAPS